MKPKFWIWFILITLLASFLLSPHRGTPQGWADGLRIGLQMSLRAAVMIIGFSVTGRELANPVIRNFFSRTRFRSLPPSLELAFDTLPGIIAAFPDMKSFFRSPVKVLHRIVSQADGWLEMVSTNPPGRAQVVIVTGRTGEGKTTRLREIVDDLKRQGIRAGGILAPAVFEQGVRTGYDVVNVATGARAPLARIAMTGETVRTGKYGFADSGLGFGRDALDPVNHRGVQLVVLDEIGPLELKGEGWAVALDRLIRIPELILIVAVRRQLVAPVSERWSFRDPLLLDTADGSGADMAGKIIEFAGWEVIAGQDEKARPEDPSVWRNRMARETAHDLDMEKYGVSEIYLIGSTKRYEAGDGSDIDLLIRFHGTPGQRESLQAWLAERGRKLADMNRERCGLSSDSLLDIHLVTDEDMEKKTSFAVMIGSPYDRAKLIRTL